MPDPHTGSLLFFLFPSLSLPPRARSAVEELPQEVQPGRNPYLLAAWILAFRLTTSP